MIVGVPAETYPDERRVALVPATVGSLSKAGLEVVVEAGAGSAAGFPDHDYRSHGARVVSERRELFASADLIVQVRGLGANGEAGRADLELFRSGQIAVGLHNPLGSPDAADQLARTGVTAFALELLPRIGRAQPMDALSSMATVAGYKAVLLAAAALDKMCPLLMTAAGTITPARLFVVGAGVAGLQAIATARRLGAVVRAYDVRPAVKEQVESLGARFVELDLPAEQAEDAGGYAKAMTEEFYQRQREMMTQVVADSDVVITTAAVPGRKAPVLVTEEMVAGMRPGAVIVDLAGETGGNCALSRPGQTVSAHGVTILAPLNLPSTVPHDASQMYGRNIAAYVRNLVSDGQIKIDLDDEIVRETLLTRDGEVVNRRVRELLSVAAR